MTKDCTFTVSDESIIAQKGKTFYLSGKKAGAAKLTVEVEIDGTKLTGSVDVTVKGNEAEPQPTQPGGNSGDQAKNPATGIIIAVCVVVVIAAVVAFVVIKRKRK